MWEVLWQLGINCNSRKSVIKKFCIQLVHANVEWVWFFCIFEKYCGYKLNVIAEREYKGSQHNISRDHYPQLFDAIQVIHVLFTTQLAPVTKLPKNRINGQVMNNQMSTKTNESPAEQKDGWEFREHLCYQTKSKHIQWRFRHFVSCSFEKVVSAVHVTPE